MLLIEENRWWVWMWKRIFVCIGIKLFVYLLWWCKSETIFQFNFFQSLAATRDHQDCIPCNANSNATFNEEKNDCECPSGMYLRNSLYLALILIFLQRRTSYIHSSGKSEHNNEGKSVFIMSKYFFLCFHHLHLIVTHYIPVDDPYSCLPCPSNMTRVNNICSCSTGFTKVNPPSHISNLL